MTQPRPRAFTLIELLVVVAVIALLLAVLLPSLRQARTVAKRTVCQSHLKQLHLAWEMYFSDHNDRFLRGVQNWNHYFAGWCGMDQIKLKRPLNAYLNLPPTIMDQPDNQVYRCDGDEGGELGDDDRVPAYQRHGNSYQTNILLIGQDQIPVPSGALQNLHEQINKRLPSLTRPRVDEPARAVLLGDNNWVNQWDPFLDFTPRSWHGAPAHHNLAFLDGHIDFQEIRKGAYVTGDYRILPYADLDALVPPHIL